MSQRGRGCLEVRPSDNPFYQPVSYDIGLGLTEHGKNSPWGVISSQQTLSRTKNTLPSTNNNENDKGNELDKELYTTLKSNAPEYVKEDTIKNLSDRLANHKKSLQPGLDGNFSFLYSKESDRIGEKINKPGTTMIQPISRAEFLRTRREQQHLLAQQNHSILKESMLPTKQKMTAEELLNIYKHEPKYEDPRYITSSVSFFFFLFSIYLSLYPTLFLFILYLLIFTYYYFLFF